MSTTTQRPTPETQDFHSTVKGTPLEKYWSAIGKCEQFERERNEAREELEANCLVLQKLQDERDAYIEKFEQAEKERDEALAALSGRTVSCSQCNESAKQLEAMREAMRITYDILHDLAEHIDACDEESLLACDSDPHPPSVFSVYGKHAKAALAKLQPFLKP